MPRPGQDIEHAGEMDRDIYERLEMFSGYNLVVRRLALLMEQIETMGIPENPAKTTDSRSAGYIAEFGRSSWELDAMEPRELARVVTETVENLRDEDLWSDAVEREEEMRAELLEFVENYKDGDR